MSTDPQPDTGYEVPGWTPPPRPARTVMAGAWVRLEPMEVAHTPGIFSCFEGVDENWRYMPRGPFADFEDGRAWVAGSALSEDPLFFTVFARDGDAPLGFLSLLRIAPEAGSIEVGYINFGPELQRTAAATEAVWLLMSYAFEAGYRRFEWKCDSLNRPSRQAAQRFGLSYEGTFRQALVVKGRNRDTTWFAAIDREYPALKRAFEHWLSPENFDATGRQRVALSALTAPILVARDPGL